VSDATHLARCARTTPRAVAQKPTPARGQRHGLIRAPDRRPAHALTHLRVHVAQLIAENANGRRGHFAGRAQQLAHELVDLVLCTAPRYRRVWAKVRVPRTYHLSRRAAAADRRRLCARGLYQTTGRLPGARLSVERCHPRPAPPPSARARTVLSASNKRIPKLASRHQWSDRAPLNRARAQSRRLRRRRCLPRGRRAPVLPRGGRTWR
jgi:hypothetical protein